MITCHIDAAVIVKQRLTCHSPHCWITSDVREQREKLNFSRDLSAQFNDRIMVVLCIAYHLDSFERCFHIIHVTLPLGTHDEGVHYYNIHIWVQRDDTLDTFCFILIIVRWPRLAIWVALAVCSDKIGTISINFNL